MSKERIKIEHIIATEFEIKKGNEIIASYPKDFDFSLENIMIEKFIPDGLHNFQNDFITFKHLVPIDSKKLEKYIAEFNTLKIKVDIFENTNLTSDWKESD